MNTLEIILTSAVVTEIVLIGIMVRRDLRCEKQYNLTQKQIETHFESGRSLGWNECLRTFKPIPKKEDTK